MFSSRSHETHFHFYLGSFVAALLLCIRGMCVEVTLVSPPDESAVNTTFVSFTCSATDNAGLSTATLYIGNEPQTATFSGPDQTDDAQLSAIYPDTNYGANTAINVDGENPHAHAVIKFLSVFGEGAGHVPLGSSIVSASLEIYCFDMGDTIKLYRLLEDWVESEVTWNDRQDETAWADAGADGPGSRADAVLDGDCSSTGWRYIDITPFVQEWSNGAPNYGIVLTDTGTNGVDFYSSEGANPPILKVAYQTEWQPIETKSLWGTSDTVTFTAVDLADQKDYVWNCLVRTIPGEQSWAPVDFRLTVDTHCPDQPVLVGPADGGMGESTSPVLEVTVSDPDADSVDVSFYGRGGPGDEFTIIVLPDTQKYSRSYPNIFTAQTQWIVDNVATHNIVFVTHEGDIVDTWDSAKQWQRADSSVSVLDGVVPYGLLPGNHDMYATTHDTTYYNQYFPYTRYDQEPWYGGHHEDRNDTNYQLFSAGGDDYIVLHLEYWPSDAVITWASNVLSTYSGRRAIITTHGFINESGERSVHGMGSTQYIWDDLVLPNDNVYFVLCGHVHDEYCRTDVVNGREVHQILADYQNRSNGGNGWLRIMRFVPAEDRVYVETYSPWLGQYETDSDSEFTLNFPMSGYSLIGTDEAVASGDNASVVWSGLSATTLHEWYVTVTDPTSRRQVGPVWTFTTTSGDTTPPTISSVDAVDIADSSARIIWTTDEPSDSVVDYGTSTDYGQVAVDLTPVTSHSVELTGLTPETTYHYRVSSKDNAENVGYSGDYVFTTLPVNVIGPSIPSPPNTPVPLDTKSRFQPSGSARGIHDQDIKLRRFRGRDYHFQTGR